MSSAADSVILAALGELSFVGTATARQPTQEQAINRLLDKLDNAAAARAFLNWHRFVASRNACQPLEDELFTTKKELRRAHAMLQATHS